MKFNLAIAGIFKDENAYIQEWIEFHRIVGVDHFFLYDNDGGSEARNLLEPYERAGIVSRQNWLHLDGTRYDRPKRVGRDKNHMAFGHAAKEHRNECRWLLKIDIDEFLLPHKGNQISEILEGYDRDRIKGIRIPRIDFGHSGHRARPPGLVTQSYLQRETQPSNYKELANTNFLSNNNWANSAHHWSYRWSRGAQRVDWSEVRDMWICHYYTKSLEESMERSSHGPQRPKTPEQWEERNATRNEVHDETMLDFGEEIRRRIAYVTKEKRPVE
ncbi:MAG: hypothetical protein CBC48_01330 [bacterium TMED88]|nr:hypothetical protein [Deltaproteobacteria bacterium]OUV36889.1 MAG: hypothetical protein CBC48_01330 [bacterium TMED88]